MPSEAEIEAATSEVAMLIQAHLANCEGTGWESLAQLDARRLVECALVAAEEARGHRPSIVRRILDRLRQAG